VPRRRCAEPGLLGPGRVCASTIERVVEALELWRENLAMIVRYACQGCSGTATREVRLDDVTHRSATQIAVLTVALAAQALVVPSFSTGRLGWYKTCRVAEPSCRIAGPYRYTLATERYEKGSPGRALVEGFADTGSVFYENVDCTLEPQPSGPDCRIIALPPPAYTSTRPPLGS
jgi:hypothetical protein